MSHVETWEARALAAERTVEVLKRKVKDLYNGGGSSIQHTVERARAREGELRRRQELTALRNEELQRYNDNLAAEVRARTHDIRVILDNVQFGFLVVGRDGKVRGGYTRSCTTLLGHDTIAGTAAVDALRLSGTARELFALQFEQLFDDVMPDEVVLAQLPPRTLGAHGCVLQIAGRALRDDAGVLDAVLFTLSDITALEAAERENANYRLLVSILRQRSTFVSFVAGFRALAAAGRDAATARNESASRRAMHTIKGDAACFGLEAIAHAAHAFEEETSLRPDQFDALEAALDAFLAEEAAVLGPIASERASLEVSEVQLMALEACTSPAQVAAWITQIEQRPARFLLGPLEALVPRLAERFEKRVDLVIEGGELFVDVELLAPVVRELGHVVRNAVDHGIEHTGTVRVVFAAEPEHYRIEVVDDGRGIDVERLVAKAIAKGLITERAVANTSRVDLLDLAFCEGVSTADSTNEISGRGVGMSAVRSAVTAAGGFIQLHSEPGRGTRVEILVPMHRDTVRARVA